jgi:hypothetical protein
MSVVMAYGCFTDRADRPDQGRAEGALGAARPLWDALLSHVATHTRSRPAWRFYGRNHGWAVAFKKDGRTLAALFPDDGRLTVLVVLGAAQAVCAEADLALSEPVRAQIASLPRFREGCWVFVRVDGSAAVEDARRLIDLRDA